MTEQEKNTPTAREMANQLALELGNYEATPGFALDLSDHLPLTLKALISDTFGLLNGIGLGMIDRGQPRIRDNLIQVIGEIAKSPVKDNDLQLINALEATISRAASYGLTADNQPLPGLKHQRTR